MHIPVLQKEVLKYLDPQPNQNFIDCTVGGAGHTLAILDKNGKEGKVLGIDQDSEILQKVKQKIANTEYKSRLILVNDNFVNLKRIVDEYRFRPIDGILFDLGMSSWHLEESGRGFSFLKDEPLDMRFDAIKQKIKAKDIVNQFSEKEIERILRDYGEERLATRIARKIVEVRRYRPIATTLQLAEIIRNATPTWYQHGRINCATRTFQALRIAVNAELEVLTKTLPQAIEVLETGGRLVVISFHSLEDRIVKNFLRESSTKEILKILTKKPVRPEDKEIQINPRSRSAKLRAAIKVKPDNQ